MLERLRTALADRYRVERELGAGGMATVFLAQDLKHHRQVAIKVFLPELAQVIGPERFLREIEIAARLQHPHILPVHDSDEADGLLYYVMPFVEGESLADRLARDGPLPTEQALRIFREVADALGYAHERGLVHRDIKPANILLSGSHALVADFGIARAVREAAGAERLTATGVTLGTPAYMAPEQAAGDKVDQRADMYALGVVAYEMLAGEPPFRARNAQMMVAAHLTEPPPPLSRYRPNLPPALSAAVMRCLDKRPADRVQSAADLLRLLEAVASFGELTPPGTEARTATPSTQRVAILFAAASLVLLALTYGLMIGLGLPDWVFPAAVALLLVGLPIVLTTSRLERRRAKTSTGQGLLTWRRAIGGGAIAFLGLGVVVVGYMGMRLLGIGPAGTLLARGLLGRHSSVLLADFEDRSSDPTLVAAVTEALRVDLRQSRAIELVQGSALEEAFKRMGRNRPALLPEELAREVAVREGIVAVIGGEVSAAAGAYFISCRVVEPASGEVLVSVRETARDSTHIIPALDRLSRRIRERIGESLKAIRESPSLERVTTPSLPALRKYSQGVRALDTYEIDRAIAHFKEAIGIDTAFAAAYRALAVYLTNFRIDRALAAEALEQAFFHRDRLTEWERLRTEAAYFMTIRDLGAARTSYQSALDAGDPDSQTALNNLGVVVQLDRRSEEALGWFRRAHAANPEDPIPNINLAYVNVDLGRLQDARAALARFDSIRPGHPASLRMAWRIAWGAYEYDSVEVVLDRFAALNMRAWDAFVAEGRLWLAGLRGRSSLMAPVLDRSLRRAAQGHQVAEHLRAVAWVATFEAVVQARPEEGLARMEEALARFPLAAFEPFDRPYAELAELYARAGRPDRAVQVLREFEREVPRQLHRQVRSEIGRAGAYITLAEGRGAEAIQRFLEADVDDCKVCALPALSHAWQEANNEDSVVAVLERYLTMPDDDRVLIDPLELPGAHARLGELYELRGDTARAIAHNARFLELWRDADPVFQPVLHRVRERQRRLTAERR